MVTNLGVLLMMMKVSKKTQLLLLLGRSKVEKSQKIFSFCPIFKKMKQIPIPQLFKECLKFAAM